MTRLTPLAEMALFLAICGVLGGEARQPLWNTHLSSDIGEYYIRAAKFLGGQLQGTEYPPFAVFYFLLPRLAESLFHIGYLDVFFYFNYVLIGLHLALLNQVAGRLPALIFGLSMLAAGPIAMFRFELLVSMLVLLAWWQWREGHPVRAGALLAAAILTKLYPLILVPLFLRPPAREADLKRHAVGLAGGLAVGVAGLLILFGLCGGPVNMFGGILSFHEQKPVALESTLGGAAMLLDYLGGSWPSQAVNTFGIHGLPLGSGPRLLTMLGLLASIGWVLGAFWKRRGDLIVSAQALMLAVLFWSTLFQPQYLLWTAVFTALLPETGMRRSRVLACAGLYMASLAAEQFVFPCGYTDFLSIFYQHTSFPGLMLAFAVGKVAVTLHFGLVMAETLRPLPPASAPSPEPRGRGGRRAR